MEKAAKTWTGEWWKYGGGGTPWDSFAFDPELDLCRHGEWVALELEGAESGGRG